MLLLISRLESNKRLQHSGRTRTMSKSCGFFFGIQFERTENNYSTYGLLQFPNRHSLRLSSERDGRQSSHHWRRDGRERALLRSSLRFSGISEIFL